MRIVLLNEGIGVIYGINVENSQIKIWLQHPIFEDFMIPRIVLSTDKEVQEFGNLYLDCVKQRAMQRNKISQSVVDFINSIRE